jgi:hypothetical protein
MGRIGVSTELLRKKAFLSIYIYIYMGVNFLQRVVATAARWAVHHTSEIRAIQKNLTDGLTVLVEWVRINERVIHLPLCKLTDA